MLEAVDRMPTAPSVPSISVGASVGQVASEIGDAASSAVGGAGGGYVFSPEEIDEVIKQWEELLEGLDEDIRLAKFIADVQAPGLEFASGDFQQDAGPSGKKLLDQTHRMRDYVQKYIQALKDARDATQAKDEEAADDVQNTQGMLG